MDLLGLKSEGKRIGVDEIITFMVSDYTVINPRSIDWKIRFPKALSMYKRKTTRYYEGTIAFNMFITTYYRSNFFVPLLTIRNKREIIWNNLKN